MSYQKMPDLAKVQQTVANLRKSRLVIESATLQIEEITAQLEHQIRQQRLQRFQRSLDAGSK